MNQKKSLQNCPICQEENGEILHTQNFVLPDGHPLSNGCDILCCDRCSFVYADTKVSQKSYDIFYAKLSKYEDKKQLREDKVQSQDLPANKSDTIKVVLQLGKPRDDLEKLWALPTQNPLIYT